MNRIEHLAEGITLYLGDCREVLGRLPLVHLCATDPPYGIAYVTNHRKIMATPEMLTNDGEAPLWCVPLMSHHLQPGGGNVSLHPR